MLQGFLFPKYIKYLKKQSKLKKISRQVFVTLVAGVIIYFLLSVYGDFTNVLDSFKRFNWIFIPLLLLLTCMNYFFRFLKWEYYLRLLGIKVERKLSASIFFSGLIMSVTPMKAGEFLKSYLLKQTINEPVSKTAPVIFAERMTDLTSLLIVGAAGGLFFNYGINLIIIVSIIFASIIVVIPNRNLCLGIFSYAERMPFIKRYSHKLYNLYESSYLMFRFKPLILMIMLSLFSWCFELIAVFIILHIFNPDITFFASSFIFAFSTVFGAVTMLPGGLGATEGSLTFLIMRYGFAKESAIASTLIIRVVTLWFAVLLGMISLYLFQKKFGNLISNDLIKETQNGTV